MVNVGIVGVGTYLPKNVMIFNRQETFFCETENGIELDTCKCMRELQEGCLSEWSLPIPAKHHGKFLSGQIASEFQ